MLLLCSPSGKARRSLLAHPSQSTLRPWLGHLLICLLWLATSVCCMTSEALQGLKQETRDIFYHGYDNYMKYAFPEDELRPLTCGPLTRDRENPAHIELNDVLGNYSLTLIDSLSTLAILASSPPEKAARQAMHHFQDGVSLLVSHYGDGSEGQSGRGSRARGFDVDSKVQVFETVIRGVGGLLSAHEFATGDLPIRNYTPITKTMRGKTGIVWDNGMVYDGQLLRLALDLAKRLLPAFNTPTGLPYPRVNLRHGVPFYANSPLNMDAEQGQCPRSPTGSVEITETCSAGAGSLVMEFTTLSRLTGDGRFEEAAKTAFWAVWQRRSTIGLIGSGIDAETGNWVTPYTGIGAGIDSFFEYAFKSHVLLSGLPSNHTASPLHSPDAFLQVWEEAHAAIKHHIYRGASFQHPHYLQVDLYTGALRAFWVDSLSAYYPGLLALAGELEEAVSTHLLYTALWTRYSALPERWSTATGNIESGLRWWGGRPEFIESTWYLYRATKDPWYLHTGEMVLRDIKRRCWTRCGWAGLQDVRSGELNDRMESFFLGETAKYLFLLFDEDHPLNTLDAPFVFTTEGHPLIIPKRVRDLSAAAHPSNAQAFVPEHSWTAPTCSVPPPSVPLTFSSTAARGDIFHAASLAKLHLIPSIENLESPLIEFTADHPSISPSDLQSPSNYTYYPWTLPLNLMPPQGSSSAMASRSTFDLSFPNLPESSSIGALSRILEGILVSSMSGLRLGMVKEPSLSVASKLNDKLDLFRIYAVSNVALGRDEKVFLSRDIISSFNPVDPYFTRTRDIQIVDIVVDVPAEPADSSLDDSFIADSNFSLPVMTTEGLLNTEEDETQTSLLGNFFQNIQSILLEQRSTASPVVPRQMLSVRHLLGGALPTGPGAAPLPDLEEPAELDPTSTKSPLPWNNVHIAGDLCDEILDAKVVKENQVLVIRRGGCSFSQKLTNIPSFAPTARALQLVIIVSFPEHDLADNDIRRDSGHSGASSYTDENLIQPLLDRIQATAAGLPRPNPIAAVMVGGGEQTIDLFRNVRGVGVRRRWWFESQGVRIANLIVL